MTSEIYGCDYLLDLVFRGNEISRAFARKLERQLIADPSSVEKRFLLLGFYYTRYFDSNLDQFRRQRHVLWCIENMYNSPFFCRSNFALVVKSDGIEKYTEALTVWMSILRTHSYSAQAHINFAVWVASSDIKLAEASLTRAQNIDSHHPDLGLAERRVKFAKDQN